MSVEQHIQHDMAMEYDWDIIAMNEGQEAQGMNSYTKYFDLFGQVRINYWTGSGTMALTMNFPNEGRKQKYLRGENVATYFDAIMQNPAMFYYLINLPETNELPL